MIEDSSDSVMLSAIGVRVTDWLNSSEVNDKLAGKAEQSIPLKAVPEIANGTVTAPE